MFNYILLLMYLVVIGFLGYNTFYLFIKAGSSDLFQRIAITGFLGLLISIISLVSLTNDFFEIVVINIKFELYMNILKFMFTYSLFRVWEIRHNQLTKKGYHLTMLILAFMNVGLLLISELDIIIIISPLFTNYLPLFSNITLLSITNLLFLRYNKLSGGIDFKFFPMVILILVLLELFIIIINLYSIPEHIYYLASLLQSSIYTLIVKLCIDDFKKSFYY